MILLSLWAIGTYRYHPHQLSSHEAKWLQVHTAHPPNLWQKPPVCGLSLLIYFLSNQLGLFIYSPAFQNAAKHTGLCLSLNIGLCLLKDLLSFNNPKCQYRIRIYMSEGLGWSARHVTTRWNVLSPHPGCHKHVPDFRYWCTPGSSIYIYTLTHPNLSPWPDSHNNSFHV